MNKKYIIPSLNYNSKESILSSLNESLNAKHVEKVFDSYSPGFKKIIEAKNKERNKYYYFCIKTLNYLKNNKIENDYNETTGEDKSPFYFGAKVFKELKTQKKDIINSNIYLLEDLTLLSLYFNQYPYLFNLLSFQEVKDLFEEEIPLIFIDNFKKQLVLSSKDICDNIKKNECILDEKKMLKELQISLIHLLIFGLEFKIAPSFLTKYYQIINFFRDIDFCLKIYLSMAYGEFNNKRHNFKDELIFSLTNDEPRYIDYLFYINQFNIPNTFNKNV